MWLTLGCPKWGVKREDSSILSFSLSFSLLIQQTQSRARALHCLWPASAIAVTHTLPYAITPCLAHPGHPVTALHSANWLDQTLAHATDHAPHQTSVPWPHALDESQVLSSPRISLMPHARAGGPIIPSHCRWKQPQVPSRRGSSEDCRAKQRVLEDGTCMCTNLSI